MEFLSKVAQNAIMANFRSGQDKPRGSGRKKGTPNKRSQILEDIFEENDFNIPEQLLKVLPNLSSDFKEETDIHRTVSRETKARRL